MLDKETVIRSPHSKDDDPRTSVTMIENWATIQLFYPPESGLSGDAAPIEVRITPPPVGRFQPQRLAPRLPLYIKYARAAIRWEDAAVIESLRDLRAVSKTSRGLPDDFFKLIATAYDEVVSRGEPYPVKAVAELNHVSISSASRWIKEAKRRGLIAEPTLA